MTTIGRKASITLLGAVLIGILSNGCRATVVMAGRAPPEEEDLEDPIPDPLEPFNREMFRVSLQFDEHVLRPVATVYAQVLPGAARRGLDRFFSNLGVVERFANNLLQGKVCRASEEVGRFAINTTLGGMGFFDVADHWFRLKENQEDFGQTLGVYGVAPGPYLFLPIPGPSTIRDAVGLIADTALNPLQYLNVVNHRSLTLELFEEVDGYAVDLYGAVQDAYWQKREREVKE